MLQTAPAQLNQKRMSSIEDILRIELAAATVPPSVVEPPKGTVYNYPIRPWHNAKPRLAAYPAPPETAVQVFNRAIIPSMWARLHDGQSIDQVIAWAKDELQGFIR